MVIAIVKNGNCKAEHQSASYKKPSV